MPRSSPNNLLTPTTLSSYHLVFKTFRRHLEHVYKRAIDPAHRVKSLTNLKSATHRYHKTIVTAANKKYYSSLIHSSSSNPRHLLESHQLSSAWQISISTAQLHSLPLYPF